MVILYIFLSVIVVSLISLIGIVYLALKPTTLQKALFWLISFAVGTMLGGAFIHLLPELLEAEISALTISLSILGGILIFFILEKIIHWRHCHMPTSADHPHALAYMNLVGDGLHNFLDGVIIAGAYLINPLTGLAATLAVIFHEIPQEIGDFSVLIYAGMKRSRALVYNLLSALTAILGAAAAIYFNSFTQNLTIYIDALAVGGFIYIAVGDLLPELKKETCFKESCRQIIGIIAGVIIMALLLFLEH